MALFILERTDREDGALYDANWGFVIRTGTALRARLIASKAACDEGPEIWCDKGRSTCRVLSEVGPDEIIMTDFNAG